MPVETMTTMKEEPRIANIADLPTGMRISNTRVYAIDASVQASGLSHTLKYDSARQEMELDAMERSNYDETSRRRYARAEKLALTPLGTGHDNYLVGIIVQADITAPRYWWPELQRYHFVEIVSSTSTMHTLMKLGRLSEKEFDNMFSPKVPFEYLMFFKKYYDALTQVEEPDPKALSTLKAMLPEGFLQTARISTNYRALRTIYRQRKGHKLQEWLVFCDWVKMLPYCQLITGPDTEKEA